MKDEQKNTDNLDHDLEQTIRDLQVEVAPVVDQRILAAATAELPKPQPAARPVPEASYGSAQEAQRGATQDRSRRRTWRFDMKRMLPVGAGVAASIVIGAFAWMSAGQSNRVFADCLRNLQSASYEFDVEVRSLDVVLRTFKAMVLEPGRLRLESHGGAGPIITIADGDAKQSLLLFERWKAVYRFDRQEQQAAGMFNLMILPGRSIHDLWGLRAGGEESLGTIQVEGRSAEGFQVTRKDDQVTERICVYVDVASRQPVRVHVAQYPAVPAGPAIELVFSNFRPAPHLDPALFRMEIPEGYTLAGRTSLEQMLAGRKDADADVGTSAEGQKILESLALWSAGDSQKAVDLLLTVEWDGDLQFAPEHFLFTMTERQWVALTTDDRNRTLQDVLKQGSQCRALGREIVNTGCQAQAAGDTSRAETCYTAAARLGRLLNRSEESMTIVRALGIAIEKNALAQLEALYGEMELPERLQEIQQRAARIQEQQEQIRRIAAGS